MSRQITIEPSYLSDKMIKKVLESYLISHGWEVEIYLVPNRGIDIMAERDKDRWMIRANLFQPSREGIVISFVSAIGEIIQRMNDPRSKYSIVFPDIAPFQRLWERLPDMAKDRIQVTALFISSSGNVIERLN